MKILDEGYAKYYSLIYSELNTKGEVELTKQLIKKYSKRRVMRILDAGCAIGRHSILLAKKGYNVLGIDQNKFMIHKAQKSIQNKKLKIKFQRKDIKKLDYKNKFDVVLCLFATVQHFTKNKELIKVLRNFYGSLRDGGILVISIFEPTKQSKKPKEEYYVKVFRKNKKINLVRMIKCKSFKGICQEDEILVANEKGRFAVYERSISLREFKSASELMDLLKQAGFKDIKSIFSEEEAGISGKGVYFVSVK